MQNWKQRYASKVKSVDEAVSRVKNGDRIYLGSMCSEPKTFIKALAQSRLDDLEMVQFLGGTEAEALAAKAPHRFNLKTFFVRGRTGQTDHSSQANYVPLFHSQIPGFFRNRRIAIDVAVVQVSEPDRFGRFSLGISVDSSLAAVESARMVIAQVNPRMPHTLGDTFVPVDRITHLVSAEEELPEVFEEQIGERERRITEYCAELIEDGSIVHFGFAGVARGLMDCFSNHKHLGLHSEIFTDSLMDLIESGVVDNSTKKMYRGKSLATCCMGTRAVYDYVHDNTVVEFYPSDSLLNHSFIGMNEKMVTVNLALQVDLRGQIRQGSPTWTAFEGSGGDQDAMRGASLSRGGRSIICIRSTSARSGKSTIVPGFGPTSAVMMNRGDVHFIVTEYGAAYLGGRSIRERAMALIEIAHPDHREGLMQQAHEMGYVYKDQFYYRTASPEVRERVRHDHLFKGELMGHVRAVKPTDESMIRDLFYHLSERSVYFRYFSPRKSMPHKNVEEYVNLKEEDGLSLVVTVGPREDRRIIAEARYQFDSTKQFAEVSFIVDEAFQGRGIASHLVNSLAKDAKQRGVKGFNAEVLLSNLPMIRVFEKTPYVLHKRMEDGVVCISFNFDEPKEPSEQPS